MADGKQLEILKQGVEVWNKWRKDNPDVEIDLSGADLKGSNLIRADFSKTVLNRQYSSSINGRVHSIRTTCTNVNLSNADLSDANLSKADLSDADLSNADLRNTKLVESKLIETNLSKANLKNTNFTNANITAINLYGTVKDNWIIYGVKCHYYYNDVQGKLRIPEERNFDKGEFEIINGKKDRNSTGNFIRLNKRLSVLKEKCFLKIQNMDPQKNWLLAIIGLLIAIISLIISYIPLREKAQFIITNCIIRSDAKIIIQANNDKANQDKQLDVVFDGYPFPKSGHLISSEGMHQWHFKIKKHTKVEKLIKDGEHKIKVRFPGDDYSKEENILFISKPPIVRVEKTNTSGQTIVKGDITTELQIPKNLLSVHISYFHEGQENKIDNIPLKTRIHEDTGITYFEFETSLQGLPVLNEDDPNFSAPFWSLEVMDQAGNKYYYEQSYSKFIALGSEKFGVGDIANVRVVNLSKDITNNLTNIKKTIRIIPKKMIEKLPPDGKPPIELNISAIGNNAAKLEWNYNIDIKSIAPLTLVYKEDKKIGVSATTEFIDYSVNKNTNYRVEQQTEEVIYSSEKKVFDSSIIKEKKIIATLPKSGTFLITTKPPDASIKIFEAGGEKVYSSPEELRSIFFMDLDSGVYKVEVSKKRYKTFQKNITINSAQKTTLNVELELKHYIIEGRIISFEWKRIELNQYMFWVAKLFSFRINEGNKVVKGIQLIKHSNRIKLSNTGTLGRPVIVIIKSSYNPGKLLFLNYSDKLEEFNVKKEDFSINGELKKIAFELEYTGMHYYPLIVYLCLDSTKISKEQKSAIKNSLNIEEKKLKDDDTMYIDDLKDFEY